MWLLLWLGSFVATLAGKDEPLCDSCIISLRSEATPTQSINTENGSCEPVLSLNSSGTSNVSPISQKCTRGRKKRKAMVMHLSRVSPSVHTLSRNKRKTPNKCVIALNVFCLIFFFNKVSENVAFCHLSLLTSFYLDRQG